MDIQRLVKGKIPTPETGIEIKKSLCAICDPGSCGLDLYIKDGEIIKVEGNETFPSNLGTLCGKGAALRQYVYHEDRIKTPLKRVGSRDSGKFEPIPWDEALGTIADTFNRIKKETGPESIVFFSGYSKFFRPYLKRLAHSFGSPNYLTESSTCYQAQVMAQKLVYGTPSGPDLMNTRCLLIWSTNLFHSSPNNARSIIQAKEKGVKIIVVDPRETPTTSHADIHLQLRPGTDGALALTMANIIINENLYDKDFIDRYTYGFNEYKEYVQSFTPEQGEEITSVPRDLIRAAARMYATIKPAAVMPSASAVVHHTNGVQNYRAVFSLIGLTNNYDIKGGNVISPISFIHTPGRIPTREHEFTQCKPWSDMPPRIGADRFPVWIDVIDEEGQAMQLPSQIRSKKPYPVRGLIGFGLNYRMWPDSNSFLDSLKKLDIFVNLDLFMTDSCKQADIVLPSASSVEISELRCYGMGYIVYSQPAIKPLYDSRSDIDIIYALADRLKLNDPLFTAGYDASLDWILEPSGITTAELKKHPEGMFVPNPMKLSEKKYTSSGFKTPSGKFEFKSKILEKYNEKPGFESLPVYTPSRLSEEATPDIAREYPFVLNTGSRLPMFIHSRTFRLTWTSSQRPNHPAADINPGDAIRLGIKKDDPIRIITPKGYVNVKANPTQMVQPGVVHFYHGYPEANANSLFDGDYLDPLSGYPGFKSALCKIEKVSI